MALVSRFLAALVRGGRGDRDAPPGHGALKGARAGLGSAWKPRVRRPRRAVRPGTLTTGYHQVRRQLGAATWTR